MDLRFRLENIDKAAAEFLTMDRQYSVIAFYGEMGAGKTTFIHALCRVIGVKGILSSPTFSIINEYAGSNGPVYHIDLYRCKDEEEAIRAGVEDCLYSGHLCLVEWPSRAESIFPADTLRVTINEEDEKTRRVTIRDAL